MTQILCTLYGLLPIIITHCVVLNALGAGDYGDVLFHGKDDS
jgi:hypothetical protein